MKRALDEPTSSGWWWCIPDPQCEWSEQYPDGVFVEVEEFKELAESVERFCVILTGTNEAVGLTRNYPSDLFGKWYGPIHTPFTAKPPTE